MKKGRPLHPEEHIERLKASLQTLGMNLDVVRGIGAQLNAAARRVQDGFVRVGVRGQGSPKVTVIERKGTPYSSEMKRRGLKLTTAASRWPSGELGLAGVKHADRLSGILVRAEVGDSAEVLRLNAGGYLTEGTVSNLFLVKDGELVTPATWLGVLDGVTRRHVLLAAGRLRIPVRETVVTRHELFNAEEAFLTNVLMGILPIREVDGRQIGAPLPGPITRRLMKLLAGFMAIYLLLGTAAISMAKESQPAPKAVSGESTVAVLMQALKDQDPKVRYKAVRVLADLGPSAAEAVPALSKTLKEDKNEAVQETAAFALGKIGQAAKPAVPLLIQAAKNERERMRSVAIFALWKIGPAAQEAIPVLIESLNEKDSTIRGMASLALAEMGPSAQEAIPALTRLSNGKNTSDAKNAVFALEKIGTPEALEAVKKHRQGQAKQKK